MTAVVAKLCLFFIAGVSLIAGSGAQQGSPQKAIASLPQKSAPGSLADANDSLRVEKFDDAIQKYQAILKTTPNVPAAYVGLTRAYLKEQKVDDAYQIITKGLAVVDFPTEHVALGEVYFRQGKIDLAEKEWVQIVNSGYPDARAYLGLSRVRRAISEYKQSKDFIDKADELDPHDRDVERAWFRTLRSNNRTSELESEKNSAESADQTKQAKLGCRLSSPVTSTQTPLTLLLYDADHVRGIGLPVVINGAKSTLMLDTGATGILIERKMAEKAGIKKVSANKIGGIGDQGEKAGYFGFADTINVGNLEFKNCPVEVIEKRSALEDDGLIGADVFSQFLVDIDSPENIFRLQPLPERPGSATTTVALQTNPDVDQSSDDESTKNQEDKSGQEEALDRYVAPEMKSYTQVFRFGHMLLIPVQINDAPSKLFLLDTGAFQDSISLNAAREATKVHGDAFTNIVGLNGRVNNVYSAGKTSLKFAHVKQRMEGLATWDLSGMSNDIGIEVSGIVGFMALRQVEMKIDYRDGLVDLIPKHLR